MAVLRRNVIGQTIGEAIASGLDQSDNSATQADDTPQSGQSSNQTDWGALPVGGSAYAGPPQPWTSDDTTGVTIQNTPVEVSELPPVPGANADELPASPDASTTENSGIETVVVHAPLTQSQLYQRFWGSLQNAQNKRQLPKEVNYTFQPNYVVARVRTAGTTETVEQKVTFQSRSATDDFLSQHAAIVTNPDGSTDSWGELLGLTTGPDQVTIYAGAVDPSPGDYTVYYPAMNGKPEINVQLDPGVWQEVSINTMFHEAYHAVEEAGGDPQSGNEYNARVYSLQHMTKGGYP